MKRLGRLALVAASLLLISTPSTALPSAQSVTATGGSFAYGGIGSHRFPDGSTREVSATIVIPGGTVVGSERMGPADLRKPFAAMSMSIAPAGYTGRGFAGPDGCTTFANPASWAPATVQRTGLGPSNTDRAVGGMRFTASCPGDPLYARYVLTFDAADLDIGPAYLTRHAPVTTAANWHWGGGSGTLEATYTESEIATLKVCGTRHNGVTDCYAGGGAAQIYQGVKVLSASAHSTH